jgi:type IV secretory pathway TrbD component
MQNKERELSFQSRRVSVILSGIVAVLMVFVSEILHSFEAGLISKTLAAAIGAAVWITAAILIFRSRTDEPLLSEEIPADNA